MKRHSFFGLLVLLSFSSVATGQSTAATFKGPPLWLVRSGDAEVYVFGRMAVGRDVQWLVPAVEAALKASDSLWLENPRAEGGQGDELIGRLGFAEGYSVLRALDETHRDRLLLMLERSGMSVDVLEGRKAWLANLFLSQLIDRIHGLDPASFPDTVFRQLAETAGKGVSSEWRDIGELVEYSVGLPEAVQLQMLGKALDDSDSYAARLAAWLRGDAEALARFADATAAQYPDAHREVNAQRNARWVSRIRSMLADADTEFVAVGIGHLCGPDNLLNHLQAAGFVVTRVN
jgi:uncharacterized protein YbaP (TraB family)